jgi:hypothetical protein
MNINCIDCKFFNKYEDEQNKGRCDIILPPWAAVRHAKKVVFIHNMCSLGQEKEDVKCQN